MSDSKKIRVAVLYGGRSGEHEISLRSAASVIRNLNPEKYDVLPVGIDKQGRWHLGDVSLIERETGESLPAPQSDQKVFLPPYRGGEESNELLPLGNDGASKTAFDVVVPVMHGPLCEDGSIQGLLELSDTPYVGAGVLASAVGMDKDVAKRLVYGAGLPVPGYVAIRKSDWKSRRESVLKRIAEYCGFPAFVKPANMGSSVGIHKVHSDETLEEKVEDAFRYDTKVLVEKFVDAREIEVAVMEEPGTEGELFVSEVGEINPKHEFYSYEAKYVDENGAELTIPADLTEAEKRIAQKFALQVFQILECEGLARVDLFMDRKNKLFYFNEINTMPGFTSISMFPKLMEATGIPYAELLDRLIQLAIERHGERSKLVRDWTNG